MERDPLTKGDRPRRLVAFPLVLLYALLLVVAAWPRLLQPIPGTVTDFQIGALEVFFALGIYPGQEVFTGDDRPREIATNLCLKITALFADGSTAPVLDETARCAAGVVPVLKDPSTLFHERMLDVAFRYARDPRRHKNLNRYPRNYLYAITEYHCRKAPPGAVAIEVAVATTTIHYDSGERSAHFIVEGQRRCGEDQWHSYPQRPDA
jgi:hypothetical protein